MKKENNIPAKPSMFYLMCLILNNAFDKAKSLKKNARCIVDIDALCLDPLFDEYGYMDIRQSVIGYLTLLKHSKTGIKYVEYSTVSNNITVLRKIDKMMPKFHRKYEIL